MPKRSRNASARSSGSSAAPETASRTDANDAGDASASGRSSNAPNIVGTPARIVTSCTRTSSTARAASK